MFPDSASGTADAIELINFSGERSYIKSKRGFTLSADYDNNSNENESNIHFETDGSEAMRIDSNGRVGIGTSSPDQILHLAKSSGATLRFESTTSGAVSGDIFGAIEFETQDSNSAQAYDFHRPSHSPNPIQLQ